ncbi:MAG: GDP-mannose 4,6-dehydratase [Methylophilaceae bacterium]|nr:GDP-mannose 4,6-dehydratase [Methylophilaceae bacterium]
MNKKTALVTGITGQDGVYLARLLLSKNYKVFGMRRRTSSFSSRPLDELIESSDADSNFQLIYGDVTDALSIANAINHSMPDEIYNLAAQSHVDVSFVNPSYTFDATGHGALRILESLRVQGLIGKVKFYQASTSELFGKVLQIPQDENTPFNPQSPYACAKEAAFNTTKLYREAYGAFAANGILFNHESPLRGETFVTRKITRGFAQMKLKENFYLKLGNLEALRDWGHAEDYVYAMWLILQADKPKDYVVSTGVQYSVRKFAELVANYFDYALEWRGAGLDEFGFDKKTGRTLIKIDKQYYRPAEVETLLGNSTLIRNELGWEPKISFENLVQQMCKSDELLAFKNSRSN